MSNDSSFSLRAEVFTYRLALILMVALFAFLAAVELSVAMNIKLKWPTTRVAMYAGLLPWVFMAVDGWRDRFKGDRGNTLLVFNLLFSTVAVISTVGMFVTTFSPFTVWANAVLSVGFFAASLFVCKHTWKDCVVHAQIAGCDTIEKARQLYYNSPEGSPIQQLALARWVELAEKL
jgi:hypothetical protein